MEKNIIYKTQTPDGRNLNYGWFDKVWVLVVNPKTKFYYYSFYKDTSFVSEDELYLFKTEEELKNYVNDNLKDYVNAKPRKS